MAPFTTSFLYTILDNQPISPEIAQEVLSTCHTAQEAMASISTLMVNYLDAPWYQFKWVTARKHIMDMNYDMFRSLDILNTKLNHLYVDRSPDSSSLASASSNENKVHDMPMLPREMQSSGSFTLPRWAEEVQKSASKTRQYAAWLRSRSETASAQQIEKLYAEMMDVYELQRLNLQAVVGMMRGILASCEAGDGGVWKSDVSEELLWRWLPDVSCEVKPLKRV
ncbi:uncharacterized protein N0V89_006528 [Didymosphaeria variabile]|uniref:Uncharacterized protein n=1 Tax=Didymosphaeria variabile TaxID=1932322 RepID=A0A9W9C8L1_9PLEO|nr:uncharacterized protein N0V89_006528 [Didymosphaeria variabile]KAJ4351189.1 hypothetical protein N0V89_006528 [Didymosphaeria variabile]